MPTLFFLLVVLVILWGCVLHNPIKTRRKDEAPWLSDVFIDEDEVADNQDEQINDDEADRISSAERFLSHQERVRKTYFLGDKVKIPSVYGNKELVAIKMSHSEKSVWVRFKAHKKPKCFLVEKLEN